MVPGTLWFVGWFLSFLRQGLTHLLLPPEYAVFITHNVWLFLVGSFTIR